MSNSISYLLLALATLLMFVVTPWTMRSRKNNRDRSIHEQFSLSWEGAALHETLPAPDLTKVKRVMPRRRKGGQSSLDSLPLVEFDPLDSEHLIALSMLMQQPQKLHPTLRFTFNPAEFDNAYSACLNKFARSRIPAAVHLKASELAKKKRSKKTTPVAKAKVPEAKVSPLVKTAKVIDNVKYDATTKKA